MGNHQPYEVAGSLVIYVGFMFRAEQYRKLAEEAAKCAQDAADSKVKEMYEQLARSWRDLAVQAERQAPPAPNSSGS